MSDIENNKKMTGNELYLIYSMTKMITCTSALQLFEQGKYKLDDPISKYLPEFEKMKISYDEINSENASKVTTCSTIGEESKKSQSGGAGLTSCAEDYALFLDAIACGGVGKNGNRILLNETVNLMKTNHLQGRQCEDFNQLRPGYGYGLGVRTHINKEESKSLSPLGEFGWDGAAGAFSIVDTENKLSLTYFQHMHGWNKSIQSELRNALYLADVS